MQSILPMHRSPRRGARTRNATSCRSPAVSGKARCPMHGELLAAARNQNARKHGRYSGETIRARRYVAALARWSRETLSEIKESQRWRAVRRMGTADRSRRSLLKATRTGDPRGLASYLGKACGGAAALTEPLHSARPSARRIAAPARMSWSVASRRSS
jgi:glucans biosynthesis protein